MKRFKLHALLLTLPLVMLTACSETTDSTTVLRICNWEEYIDEGDWDEDEAIKLSDDNIILGDNAMINDFEEWYYDTYGERVKVEYSTFGTNEELYNQITIGDVYDLVCPSEYMIMKMVREDMITPYSDDFKDTSIDNNYYTNNVSPYINSVFKDLSINGEQLDKYAAGYMWGTLGLVYNPEYVSDEEAEHWDLLLNTAYNKRVTIKDSVRDAYFGAICIANYDEITSDDFINAPDYHARLSKALNRTDVATVDRVQDILTECKNNVYSFETDSGKADQVTGKVVACQQWSGDAVYTMDQIDEEGVELRYSAPTEGTNLWFDGWVMLKKGLAEDSRKQHAAEAFVNFVSRPDNAIRNMYYIGYTSVISGGDSGMIYDYIDYCYGADEEDEDTTDYNLGYFFDYENENADSEYSLTTTTDQAKRQLYAQYPTKDVVDRSVVMACFEDEANVRVNRMWINIRCFDLKNLFTHH